MTESSKGLPELTSGAWCAFLLATFLALALGVYPFVGYPAIMRRYAGASGAMAVFFEPLVVAGFAGATLVLLVLAFTGRRAGVMRSRLAYLALGTAGLGVVLLVGALKSLVLRAS